MNINIDDVAADHDPEGGLRGPGEGEAARGELLPGPREAARPRRGDRLAPRGLAGAAVPANPDPGGTPLRCLDTPLLLDLLLDRPGVGTWLPGLQDGQELCTTEVNLYELALRSERLGIPRRAREAIARPLRRELTVLGLTRESIELAEGFHRGPGWSRGSTAEERLLVPLILGGALSQGARELWTSPGRWTPKVVKGLKVHRVGRTPPG